MKKSRLFTPGPTPLIPAAQLAMAQPAEHHRSAGFQARLQRVAGQLQQLFGTSEPVVILTSSGTGAMEAAFCAVANPETKALAVSAGKFGARWLEIARRHGISCAALKREYGQTATPEDVAEIVEREAADLLLLQGCETSTATAFDLEGIAEAVRGRRPETLIVVDAITAIGCQPVRMDAWGLDIIVSGSQKGFSAPAGLAMVAVGERAREAMERAVTPPFYLDLRKELAGQASGRTAWTPAVPLVAALESACEELLRQGLEKVIEEASLMASATRAGLQALGFRLVSENPANALTAAYPPDGVEADALRRTLEETLGVKVAGGQGPLKGKIIRIAHLGYFDRLDVVTVLAAIELTLASLSGRPADGTGPAAALAHWQDAVAPVGAR